MTPRWVPLRPHPTHLELLASPARFRVVWAGRRSGKTERAKRYTIRRGLTDSLERQYDIYRYFFAAPTRDQAKAIYWSDLKAMIAPELRLGRPNETELTVRTVTGAEFCVVGLDKPERIEGRPWNGGVLDEYANTKAKAWPENIRPALSDRGGWAWLIGVPEGRNHFYELSRQAMADDTGEWAGFTWPSADILDPAEIESARRNLDELTFAQEYEASFVNFQGRAYYAFTDDNLARLDYDPAQRLVLAFDFNVEPGVALAIQEQQLPNGQYGTAVVGEVWIERGSNTRRVAERLVELYGGHLGDVRLYGDASGGARGTAQLDGSDWDILRSILRPVFGDRLAVNVPPANPAERARVNAMNARICSADGVRRLYVDPSKAPHLVRDLEGVAVAEDGQIVKDKKQNKLLTHISDALGYYVVYEHPSEGARVSVSEIF